jgi:hypothetical protein
MFAGHVFYHLSHTLTPFCFIFIIFFLDRVSYLSLRLSSDHCPPSYGLTHSWDHRCELPCLDYWLRWSLVNFFLRLALNCNSPHFIPSRWYYRCKLPCPALNFFFGGTGVWTQGFLLVKQALYCLSHTSSPFCSDYFWREGLVNCLLRLASQTLILLISSSLVAPAWLQPWIFILRKNFVLQTSLCDFFLLLSCWRSNPGPHTC